MNVLRRTALTIASLAIALPALAATAPPASAAVGDDVIAWVEVEDGVISGGAAGLPGFNSGDHGNFSGTGSYTFRETGMTSTMSVTAPAAGTYPIYVRYAAGPLGADENVTRSMGLLTNGGNRQQMSLPMTSYENWEAWRFVEYDVTLNQGANTVAIQCDRGIDFCRLNFDAIQVGGTAPDPCAAIEPAAGYTSLYDGTFATFDGWRKAGAGGFGRQTDCTITSVRGRGATWFTTQQTGPFTLELDWRRDQANDDSGIYLGSSSRGGADPVGGYKIPIGADAAAIIPTGGTTKTANATAVAAASHPLGAWNHYTIEATSSRIRVLLNGTLVNSLDRTGTTAPTGFIGLENRSLTDEVAFRDIQVRPDVDLGEIAAPLGRAVLAGGAANPGGESTLGNLVAESYRWATRTPSYGAAQIALVQPDALGADLTGSAYPATVTDQQVGAAQPAADTLVNLRLTGAQLRTALEQQWQRTAGGTVPARAFVRLGTSAGFTATYDPTRAEGSRVTGMWLDGVAITPATSYSVTAPAALAAGGDNFRVLADGTSRTVTDRVGRAALADYLSSASGPVAADTAQHQVGVAFPGGQAASYAPGEDLDVDLTSLAFSAAGDLRDETLELALDGESLGTVPVDNTLGSAAADEYGVAAIRTSVPVGTAPGPATLTAVGTTTGTTVEVPITVAAGSTTALAVAGPVRAGRTTTATVTVTSRGGTPTGQVEILAGSTRLALANLSGGKATATIGPFTTVGRQVLTARYLGAGATRPSTSPATSLTIARTTATLTAKVTPGKVTTATRSAKVVVQVKAAGLTPTGKVRVKVGGTTVTGALKAGKVTLKLPRLAKPGTVTAVVTYLGDARIGATSKNLTIKVGR